MDIKNMYLYKNSKLMPLFQTTVLRKYLASHKELNHSEIERGYDIYKTYLLDPAVQENIRNSSESQFQEGFLRELFGKVLGYTVNPDKNFNLKTEWKNEQDSKKADAAIIVSGAVRAVIELKDLKTVNLKNVEQQAFGYKTSHSNCTYVIISNFEKLNFYIDNRVAVEEFNLFKLSKEEFVKLHLLLSYKSIVSDLPLIIKNESITVEQDITDRLYLDYSKFKEELFEDLVNNNNSFDNLLLFKKSQKLLDRLLFIFFAEDKGLLPPNSMSRTIEKWQGYIDDPLVENPRLYDRLKSYFNLMNVGHSGLGIYSYNGGLFAPDAILDSLVISDSILKFHIIRLAAYDFASEVDVNILGHIFEHSLKRIDELTSEIKTAQKVESFKKKNGVFYTPPYITSYIIENTLGELCSQKKLLLGINDESFSAGVKRQKRVKEKLLEILNNYRDWLHSLTICDPACGSGAFLNAALDFLIKEHGYIDELYAAVTSGGMVFSNVESSILENNLFGVDINEESVEITKLSLWLHTAKPYRKLNTLSNNIKCGNSLISDKQIAGELAFNWAEEFPHVFASGGFDVIIGNPPYIFARENFSPLEKEYYNSHYSSAKYQINTYMLFIERSVDILKQQGVWGLIVPNSWLMIYSAEELRRYMLSNCSLSIIVNLLGESFKDVGVETIIAIGSKKELSNSVIKIYKTNDNVKDFNFLHDKSQSEFLKNDGLEFNVFADETSNNITDKLSKNSIELDVLCSVKAGLQAYEKGKGTPPQSADDVKNRPYDYTFKFDEHTYQYLEGTDVQRYLVTWGGSWLRYGEHLAAPRALGLFAGEKVIVREITGSYPRSIISVYSDDVYLFNRSNIAIVKREEYDVSLKYVSAVLNSSVMSYYFIKNTAKAERKLFPKVILKDLRKFPIPFISQEEQLPIIELVDLITSLYNDISEKKARFYKRVSDNFAGVKIVGAIKNFQDAEFKDIIAQFKKQKIQLSLEQQDEWETYHCKYKNECVDLAENIDITDSKIDKLIYDLYELSTEEIDIIENEGNAK